MVGTAELGVAPEGELDPGGARRPGGGKVPTVVVDTPEAGVLHRGARTAVVPPVAGEGRPAAGVAAEQAGRLVRGAGASRGRSRRGRGRGRDGAGGREPPWPYRHRGSRPWPHPWSRTCRW